MPPPFDIDSTSPSASDIISAFPADEQAFRAVVEEWLSYISDPATGMIRASVSQPPFPSGTKMLFVQTAAPTGWTKDVVHNDKALRIVSGTADTGGSVAFTTAFASKAVAGTVGDTSAGGTVGATTLTTAQIPSHTHAVSGSTGGGGGPADGRHQHTYEDFSIYAGLGGTIPLDSTGGSNARTSVTRSTGDTPPGETSGDHSHTLNFTSGAAGSSGSHTHSFSGSSHTHTFTGTAINLAVSYVDVIIATKDV